MKLKKVLAGVMAIVFSLNLVQINVKAEESTEEVSTESVVVVKNEEVAERGTAKEVVTKNTEVSVKGTSSVVGLAVSGIKSLLNLAGVGIKYMAIGACGTVGGMIVVMTRKHVLRIIKNYKVKSKVIVTE